MASLLKRRFRKRVKLIKYSKMHCTFAKNMNHYWKISATLLAALERMCCIKFRKNTNMMGQFSLKWSYQAFHDDFNFPAFLQYFWIKDYALTRNLHIPLLRRFTMMISGAKIPNWPDNFTKETVTPNWYFFWSLYRKRSLADCGAKSSGKRQYFINTTIIK